MKISDQSEDAWIANDEKEPSEIESKFYLGELLCNEFTTWHFERTESAM